MQSISTEINDQGLANAIEGCTKMDTLSIVGCMRLSKLSLVNIGRCLPDLASLCFNAHGFPAVGNDITLDDALLALAEGCEQLTHLEVPTGVVTHTAIGYLSGFCSNLRSLSLGQSRGLTDESLADLGEGCADLERQVHSLTLFSVEVAQLAERRTRF